MEYYGGSAASTSPLPNIYRQHRRHKSSSARGGGTVISGTAGATETETGATSSSPSTARPGASTSATGSTFTSSRHTRTSSSSEFSSRSRSLHERPQAGPSSGSFLSRVTGGNISYPPKSKSSATQKKTPNKLKRRSFSRSQPPPPPALPPPVSSPGTFTSALTSTPTPPISIPAPTPTLKESEPTAILAVASIITSDKPVSSEADHLSDVRRYHPSSPSPPASPTFPSVYLPDSKFVSSHPPSATSSTTRSSASVSAAAALSGAPTDRAYSAVTLAATATTATANAGGGIDDSNNNDDDDGQGDLPPPPPPKTPPIKSSTPDPRMLANASNQSQVKHQKQLPALPPHASRYHQEAAGTTAVTSLSPSSIAAPRTPSAPTYTAPLPPLPPSATAVRPATIAIATLLPHHYTNYQHYHNHNNNNNNPHPHPHPHPHTNIHPNPPPSLLTGVEDRQQHHATMFPEPGTPNPSTPSASSHSLHLPLQPLSRFSVPFARTESIVSSNSAGTTLSSRTMQSSDPPSASTEDVTSRHFIVRNGRTHLNDPTLPYPLPVDLAELHRQSLRTLLLFQLFGGPVCSPAFQSKPPSRVLEVGCGSGFWSMLCHRHFARHGHASINFTGVDIAPLSAANAPTGDVDIRPDQDMKWRFVQHDLRRAPWPFQDAEFDLVMVKDMSLATSTTGQQSQMDEILRILRPGGTLEIWESDHTIRLLRPHVRAPLAEGEDEDLDNAESLGAYVMTANTPLSAPLNNYLVEYNGWISKAFDARSISTVPCTTMGPMLLQESEMLVDIRSRRLAVPLCEMRWEREGVGGVVTKDGKSYIETRGKSRDIERRAPLSAGQVALRRTALLTVVQMIQSLEPVLRDVGGKSQDEWDGWVGKMMGDLLGGGTSWGECLEVGAWWAKKRA